jgi:hypothetical protein
MASLEVSRWSADVKLARDLTLALVVGFLTGALAIPVVINLGIAIKIPLALLPIIVAVLFALGLLVASLVAGRAPSLFEFSKFAIVGVLNSGVDFGILNPLILLTGMASGGAFLGFKSISVTLGVINSYLWNKYWTFQVDVSEAGAARRELLAFTVVTLAACSQRGRRRRDRKRDRRPAWNQHQGLGQRRRNLRRGPHPVHQLLRL